jgi:TatD DNase family protein
MKFFDTHAHVNFNAYKEDSSEVIERAIDHGISMMLVGSQYSTSRRAIRLAERYPENVWAAVGLHPFHLEEQSIDEEEGEGFVTKQEEFDENQYKELASHESVAAIGEVGLDFWKLPKERAQEIMERQKKTLFAQCKMASELQLPLLFHCRGAHQELIGLLREWQKQFSVRGIIHCFTGTQEEAHEYLAMGFFLGLNGIIFKLPHLQEVIKSIPQDRIVLETDCPYLTPPPHDPKERNEPLFITHIAEKVAAIRNEPIEQVASFTSQNARDLFKKS